MKTATLDHTFRALAEPTRLRIVSLLLEGELCVGDLVTLLEVPQPTASRHLSQLKEAGLITCRKAGRWCFYSLSEGGSEVHGNLLACIRAGVRTTPDLRRDAARARKLRAAGGCCP